MGGGEKALPPPLFFPFLNFTYQYSLSYGDKSLKGRPTLKSCTLYMYIYINKTHTWLCSRFFLRLISTVWIADKSLKASLVDPNNSGSGSTTMVTRWAEHFLTGSKYSTSYFIIMYNPRNRSSRKNFHLKISKIEQVMWL